MNTKVTAMHAVRGLAVATIALVAAAAFRLSFVTLRDLAILARIPASDAWLFPVIIDATTATAGVSAMVVTDRDTRRWFTTVLIVGTAVSIALNAVHSVADGKPLPGFACAMVAAIAPFALLVDTHGLVLLFRAAQRIPSPVTEPVSVAAAEEPKPVSVAVREPVADPDPVQADLLPLDPPADPPMVAVAVSVTPPPPRPLPVRSAPITVPVVRPVVPVTR